MTRQEVFKELQEIFRDTFDDDDIVLREETDATEIEDWDSLRQITILAAAESAFHIKLAISDTRNLKNVGALVDVILSKMK